MLDEAIIPRLRLILLKPIFFPMQTRQPIHSFKASSRVSLVLALFLAAFSGSVRADETLFGYAYGAETLPKGRTEVVQTFGLRHGKGIGRYDALDLVTELEYALTDRLTLEGSLAAFRHNYAGLTATEAFPEDRKSTQFAGWNLGVKYMVLSPYKNVVGFAIIPEIERREVYRINGDRIRQWSFETTFALQKNFLDDTLIAVCNYTLELERRVTPGTPSELEEEISHELNAGITYRFAPRWFAGLETRYQTDYVDVASDPDDGSVVFNRLNHVSLGKQFQYGWYAGPVLHYASTRWWVTAGLLWQVRGAKDEDPAFADLGSRKHYEEHEDYHLRLKIGIPF